MADDEPLSDVKNQVEETVVPSKEEPLSSATQQPPPIKVPKQDDDDEEEEGEIHPNDDPDLEAKDLEQKEPSPDKSEDLEVDINEDASLTPPSANSPPLVTRKEEQKDKAENGVDVNNFRDEKEDEDENEEEKEEEKLSSPTAPPSREAVAKPTKSPIEEREDAVPFDRPKKTLGDIGKDDPPTKQEHKEEDASSSVSEETDTKASVVEEEELSEEGIHNEEAYLDVKEKSDPTQESPSRTNEEGHVMDEEQSQEEKEDVTKPKTPKKKSKDNDDEDKVEVIECPLVQDILVGMGQALKAHPGNQRMVAIIAVHRDRYEAADENGKKILLKEVTSEVKRGGTRFLKVNESGTGWIRCSKREIRSKVLECLRLGRENTSGGSEQEKQASASDPNTRGIARVSSIPASLLGRKAGQLQGPAGGGADASPRMNSSNRSLSRGGLPMTSNGERLLDPSRSGQVAGLNGVSASQASLSDLEGASSGARPANGITVQNPGGLVQGPPLRTDVVIGREALLYSQEGNLHLQTLVQANVGQDIIPTEMKKLKAKAILDRMVMAGTRFLMKEADGRGLWYHLSDGEAQTVIYRGLCEEERRIQILLYTSLAPAHAQARPGLPGELDRESHASMLPQLRMGMDLSTDAEEGKKSETIHRASGPPKKKYKKRLRKVIEERRRLSLPSSNDSVIANANKAVVRRNPGASGKDFSDDSSDSSDANSRSTILSGPIEIRPYDVIMGRGRGSFNHPGNKNLIQIFRRSKVPYGLASKNEKIQMARDIVADIQSKGGRFLKRHNDDTWEIISNKDAYKKVGHGIRDLKEEDATVESNQRDADPETKSKKREREDDGPSSPSPKKYAKLSGGNNLEESMDLRHREVLEAARKIERERLFPSASKTTTDVRNRNLGDDGKKKGNNAADSDSKGKQEDVSMTFKGYEGELQPRSIDVVCGRGKAFNRHPGNRKMHDAVTKLKYQYRDSTSQEEKSQIAHTVLRAIQDVGGKFLKYDESKKRWEELTYKNALKKIYHSIRDSLYNDRATNLNESEAEVTRKADKKRSEFRESKHRRDSNSSIDTSGSRHWKDTGDPGMRNSGLLASELHLRSQHDPRLMPGPIGSMRHQLSAIAAHEHHESPLLHLHDNQARAALAAANPLMQQHLMNAGRHPAGGHPWPIRPDHPHGRMALGEYEAASRAYHDEIRAATADGPTGRRGYPGLESSGIHSAASRDPRHEHPQYFSMGGMRRY